uniref:Chromosome 10 C15orf61 homolog n=1 Tax=Taeniopygia guttata TaxID=59729 RepID=A0A674GNH6_TAEGU
MLSPFPAPSGILQPLPSSLGNSPAPFPSLDTLQPLSGFSNRGAQTGADSRSIPVPPSRSVPGPFPSIPVPLSRSVPEAVPVPFPLHSRSSVPLRSWGHSSPFPPSSRVPLRSWGRSRVPLHSHSIPVPSPLGPAPGRRRRDRAELRGMRAELRGMRAELRGMRAELRGMRAELRGMRAELRGMRAELRGMRAVLRRLHGAAAVAGPGRGPGPARRLRGAEPTPAAAPPAPLDLVLRQVQRGAQRPVRPLALQLARGRRQLPGAAHRLLPLHQVPLLPLRAAGPGAAGRLLHRPQGAQRRHPNFTVWNWLLVLCPCHRDCPHQPWPSHYLFSK